MESKRLKWLGLGVSCVSLLHFVATSKSFEVASIHESMGMGSVHEGKENGVQTVGHSVSSNDRCALCFFGLTRSYKNLVLPSIVKNVLAPNAKYNCDVFIHFYDIEMEVKGRFNSGGAIHPNDVYGMRNAFNAANSNAGTIRFVNDTLETFMRQMGDQLQKYLQAKNEFGKHIYFPYKDRSWKESTLVNLVKQWHSINSVFNLMEEHIQNEGYKYSRVAMLRNDVMFLTPIDIWEVGENIAHKDNYFVVPPFALYPVNDRMVYGPYEAVRIWSTQRFRLLEDWANNMSDAGYTMHSERFMKGCIFPEMEKMGYKKWINPKICFIRTRPASRAMYNDCSMSVSGFTVGYENPDSTIKSAEAIVGKTCNVINGNARKRNNRMLDCSRNS